MLRHRSDVVCQGDYSSYNFKHSVLIRLVFFVRRGLVLAQIKIFTGLDIFPKYWVEKGILTSLEISKMYKLIIQLIEINIWLINNPWAEANPLLPFARHKTHFWFGLANLRGN